MEWDWEGVWGGKIYVEWLFGYLYQGFSSGERESQGKDIALRQTQVAISRRQRDRKRSNCSDSLEESWVIIRD